MNLVFCGTPPFAVPTLQRLAGAGFQVRLVVTQPDRPSGRGLHLAPSPVKQCALQLGLPVSQPARIKINPEFQSQLTALQPDAIIVVGYGRIIPQWMIDLPRLGNLNLHASLLPKYRGAAPIQWAIAEGEAVSGVTTMRIDAGLDTGDILLQRQLAILADDTAETLAPRLAAIGADLMVETLQGLQSGTLPAVPQDPAHATLAPILEKEDGLINFQRPAKQICDRLRGFQPWPGAFTTFRGRNLHLWRAVWDVPPSFRPDPATEPGTLLIAADRIFVACGHNTALECLQLQPEGKKRMPAPDFLHGYHPRSGDRLGTS